MPSSTPAPLSSSGVARPWLVDQARRQLPEFGHPAPDIGAVGIEFFALQDRIEHAEIGRGIGAGAGHPLPVGGIAAGVGIDQRVPEPLLALAPVDQEMLDQERRHHHPHPVVHDAGVPELAHPGIDDGIAGLAALPRPQRRVVAPPGKRVEGRLQIAVGEVGHVEQQMAAEFAPAQLAQELVDVARQGRPRGRGKARGVPDLPRADLAKTQMRRQPDVPSRSGRSRWIGIAGHAGFEKCVEPGLRRTLARFPALAQAAGPVGMRGFEAPGLEPVARDIRCRSQLRRGRQWLRRIA